MSECQQQLSSPSVSNPVTTADGGLYGTESVDCFDVTDCGGEFLWSASAWGECQLTTPQKDLTDLCRSSLKRHFEGEAPFSPSLLTGVQSRTVSCVLRSETDGSQREAPEQYCDHVKATKPALQQACATDYTCYRWGKVQFSQVCPLLG